MDVGNENEKEEMLCEAPGSPLEYVCQVIIISAMGTFRLLLIVLTF